MLSNIGLLKGIMAKMNWLDQNQQVLAQNVANADTPGYHPMSLKDKDFKSLMGSVAGDNPTGRLAVPTIKLTGTNPAHMGAGGAGAGAGSVEGKQKVTYEASPDDNGVVLEEQLYKANLNSMNYQIATDLYRRNVGMIRMVVQGSR